LPVLRVTAAIFRCRADLPRAANNLGIARFLVALDGWHTEALIATRDSAVRSCAVAAVAVGIENYSIRTYCHSDICTLAHRV